jgi:cytochrome c-type biogenesis protein
MPGISNIGPLTAFVAGAISFLSPCVLPLVPGYLFCVAGRAVSDGPGGGAAALRLPAVGLSVCFVLGFSTVFVLLGASATALGQLLLAYRYELNIVGGAIIVLFGLFVIGLLRPPWLLQEFRFHATMPGGRRVSAYVLGLAFAFGWTAHRLLPGAEEEHPRLRIQVGGRGEAGKRESGTKLLCSGSRPANRVV